MQPLTGFSHETFELGGEIAPEDANASSVHLTKGSSGYLTAS